MTEKRKRATVTRYKGKGAVDDALRSKGGSPVANESVELAEPPTRWFGLVLRLAVYLVSAMVAELLLSAFESHIRDEAA